MPIDDARLPGDRVEQSAPLARRRQRPGHQRHPSRLVVTAEHAALGHRPEHRDDRAVVLLGEHLGRGEQRGLTAGVDHLEHGPQRDDGLARPDLALEQPMHRRRLPEVVADLVADLALPVGELERQPLVEPVEQPARASRTRHRLQRTHEDPTLGQHGLEDERLVVLEATSSGVPLLPAVGSVQRPDRCVVRQESLAGADLVGQRVRDRSECREGERDRVHDHLRGQLGARGIDRQPAADRPVADRVLELVEVVAAAEDLARRMGQLALAVEDRDLAAEQGDRARLELVLPPVLAEEGADQVTLAVGDGDLGAGRHPAATLRPELLVLDALGLRQHGDVLVEPQVAEVGQLPAVLEPPRVVLEQVADGADVEDVGQQLRGLVADDAAHRGREFDRGTHHSTPMSSG